MDHALRRRRLADSLADVDALFVTRPSNVRYLSGFTGSNAQLLVGREGAVLFTDGRYQEQVRHQCSDLDAVIYLDGRPPVIGEPTTRLGVHRLGFEGAFTSWSSWNRLAEEASSAGIDLIGRTGDVEGLRRIKDPEEVRLLEAAQEATDVAFERVVLAGLREGMTERELSWELERAMRAAGAEGLAFTSIIAFGENAAEPHHGPTDRPLRRGDVVKCDFGALVDGYHADMTRTFAFGTPSPRLVEIRDLVFRAQAAGIAALRPGVTLREVDAASRSVIADAGLADAFPHGLGHGVGLDIHEDPFLRWDSDVEIGEGTVVTIEPGVYIPGLGGVRIEDSVEVTARGGRPLPRSPKEFVLT